MYFRHCKLVKQRNAATSERYSWLPEQFAVVNKTLKLRDDNGNWDNGWVVVEASSNKLEESQVPDYHNLIKSHRKATGDALKK